MKLITRFVGQSEIKRGKMSPIGKRTSIMPEERILYRRGQGEGFVEGGGNGGKKKSSVHLPRVAETRTPFRTYISDKIAGTTDDRR